MDKNLEMTYFIMRNGHNCMSQIECTPSTILYIWYLDYVVLLSTLSTVLYVVGYQQEN